MEIKCLVDQINSAFTDRSLPQRSEVTFNEELIQERISIEAEPQFRVVSVSVGDPFDVRAPSKSENELITRASKLLKDYFPTFEMTNPCHLKNEKEIHKELEKLVSAEHTYTREGGSSYQKLDFHLLPNITEVKKIQIPPYISGKTYMNFHFPDGDVSNPSSFDVRVCNCEDRKPEESCQKIHYYSEKRPDSTCSWFRVSLSQMDAKLSAWSVLK
eukprot:GHVP01039897.1.p1 GENE.GHVP01039897.1~~GHVP01039897.1.p1  ORF type:complete len:215 (+),score=32.72 GHVP01039897.1:96-740(+)